MALFTGKGDDGTTKTFNCPPGKRVSKNSAVAEALGSLDEINSFLGLCKVKIIHLEAVGRGFAEIIHEAQKNLFIVQAEVAGAPKSISSDKVVAMEELVNKIEKELPPIKTFFISGGSESATLLDVARTFARRAERRVVAGVDAGEVKISDDTKSFLNRLSSLLYALARLANHLSGIKEEAPEYK